MELILLDEKKSIKQLVEVDTNESILNTIIKELDSDNYNFIITSENIPFAKKQMAVLNKSIKFIDTFRKDKVNAESVAIDEFTDNVKAYLALIDTKREQIKKDVEVFEKEAKSKILKELSLYCEDFIKVQGIRDNFKDVNIVDLMVLGSITSKGSLTKKARDVIESRVMVCKSKQDKHDMRLMQLENLSYKAGLESPLTITHIQGIIALDDDAEYETKLNGLIASEIERQNMMKASIEVKIKEQAKITLENEHNHIRGIFQNDYGSMGLTIQDVDNYINKFTDYDFSEFGDSVSFAKDTAQHQIDRLRRLKYHLECKAKEDATPSKVEVVHEVIPSDEKTSQPNKNMPKTEANKKLVRINAVFEVEVPLHVGSVLVLNKVRSRLSDCDINSDTLKSLEVIQ